MNKTDKKSLWDQAHALLDATEDDDRDKLDRLIHERNREKNQELPHPTCCTRGGRYIFCVLQNSDEPPRWEHKFRSTFDPKQSGDEFLEIEFCPFCGTKLPELRKKAEPPPHVFDLEDEYQCSGCGGRHLCICSYPESAWEIVPKE